MNIAKIDELVQAHLKARFQQLGSKNKLSVQLTGRGDWFFEEVDHWNYQAAIQATEKVWGVTPNITSEGGRYAVSTRELFQAHSTKIFSSIPIALDFKKVLNSNVVLLPVGRADDHPHSENGKCLP
jgi:Cys-Gly metallodipeptidase DUG1